jgi:hypothetical protein
MVELVDLTHDHLKAFFGHDDGSRFTIKGYAGVHDGEVIAVGGVIYQQGRIYAFLDLKPEARKFPVTIHRAGLGVVQMIREARYPHVFLTRNENEPNADRWLSRLGFERVPGTSMAYVLRGKSCART